MRPVRQRKTPHSANSCVCQCATPCAGGGPRQNGDEGPDYMAALGNPRHEQFRELIAAGHTPARPYIVAGYSEKTAYTSGLRLLKMPAVRARVIELQHNVAQAAVERAAVDRDWVLPGLRKIAENGSSESARVRALELVGKELGMFKDRLPVVWDGRLESIPKDQLPLVLENLLRQAYGDDPEKLEAGRQKALLEAGAQIIDGKYIDISEDQ